jgi:hypothetical protein
VRGLTPYVSLRTPTRSKTLKAGRRDWRQGRKSLVESAVKRHEGNGHRRDGAAAEEGKTLKSETRTWQQGEINLQGRQRRKPSRR